MNIPFVINNQKHKLADVLNELLRLYQGNSLDVSTACFNVRALRKANDAFTATDQIDELLAAVKSISSSTETPNDANTSGLESKSPVKREDLKLICFDYIWQRCLLMLLLSLQ